ncbi:MAG: hypothetical protein C5B60_05210 [Chloroflexi bacterium]|nr:MAG: hypothetical protein C5B60_05210 [Chloroflexota bacterium]
MVIVIVSAAWVAYSVLGGADNPQVFLTIVMVLSIVLVGGPLPSCGSAKPTSRRDADEYVKRLVARLCAHSGEQ